MTDITWEIMLARNLHATILSEFSEGFVSAAQLSTGKGTQNKNFLKLRCNSKYLNHPIKPESFIHQGGDYDVEKV